MIPAKKFDSLAGAYISIILMFIMIKRYIITSLFIFSFLSTISVHLISFLISISLISVIFRFMWSDAYNYTSKFIPTLCKIMHLRVKY